MSCYAVKDVKSFEHWLSAISTREVIYDYVGGRLNFYRVLNNNEFDFICHLSIDNHNLEEYIMRLVARGFYSLDTMYLLKEIEQAKEK